MEGRRITRSGNTINKMGTNLESNRGDKDFSRRVGTHQLSYLAVGKRPKHKIPGLPSMPFPKTFIFPTTKPRGNCRVGGMDEIREQIEELNQLLIATLNPLRILLAGPHAFSEGDFEMEADVFLLVIAREETKPEAFARSQELQREYEKEFPLQLLLGNPEQILARREHQTRWLEMVLSEGEVLFEAADYEESMIQLEDQ